MSYSSLVRLQNRLGPLSEPRFPTFVFFHKIMVSLLQPTQHYRPMVGFGDAADDTVDNNSGVFSLTGCTTGSSRQQGHAGSKSLLQLH